MDEKEIGRIFYRDGYRLAHDHLDRPGSGLREAVRSLYEAIDGLLESFLKRSASEGKPAACRKGCAWCCHQAVFAVTHELLYLRDHAISHCSPGQQDIFTERAAEKSMETVHKSLDEQLRVRAPCPFLEKGECAVYQARPMACRIYLSSSEGACRKEYDEPGRDTVQELYGFPLRAGRMLNEGFTAYLKQIGLTTEEWPLEQGYTHVVKSGRTLESWIKERPC